MNKNNATIIDGKGLILGRMASVIARRLLEGEKIVIINAEEAIISGKRRSILREAHEFLQVGHFRKGPLHPRRPDGIVKKVIRGMLPRRKARGKEALNRLKVHIGEPERFKDKEKETIYKANVRDLKGPFLKVSDLAHNIGWSND
jgi:large subunit ribosomal protein L13